ncbi:three component ABC system middle component [Hoeflea marina]|uniref:three component ABC system middle component n=1 Tax=Hoeflea marina TaxID=274592 RepID=UPI0011B560B9|nr:three component ABC system middle component [Hoeflea marina]
MLEFDQHYSELEITQNPALGAYALWQFGLGHQEGDADLAPIPLVFLVIPMVFHARTLARISSTFESSGLGKLVQKISENREELLSIHQRALAMRELSLNSLVLGISRGLITPYYEAATIRSTSPDLLPKVKVPDRAKKVGTASRKLGIWFSQFDTTDVVRALNVSL